MPFTLRQRQVADRICQGKTNRQIANELSLSDGSIKQYVTEMLARSGMPNRTALAVNWALRCDNYHQ